MKPTYTSVLDGTRGGGGGGAVVASRETRPTYRRERSRGDDVRKRVAAFNQAKRQTPAVAPTPAAAAKPDVSRLQRKDTLFHFN